MRVSTPNSYSRRGLTSAPRHVTNTPPSRPAIALAVDICDTVEFFYRKDPDAASRRAKCANWGVVYVYDDGEPQPTPPAPLSTTTPAK